MLDTPPQDTLQTDTVRLRMVSDEYSSKMSSNILKSYWVDMIAQGSHILKKSQWYFEICQLPMVYDVFQYIGEKLLNRHDAAQCTHI